jgi:hypothetical protein
LIVLSDDLKNKLSCLCNNNIYVLPHPSENPLIKFSMGKLVSNPELKLLHVGNWMRKLNVFENLNIKIFKKTILTGVYDDKDEDNKDDVNKIGYLTNNEYDEILSKNVVCIILEDASAINTVIECVLRNTPIFINPLPAIKEVLGNDYPLYINDNYNDDFDKKLNTSLISQAYTYLQALDKTKFTFEYFNKTFTKILTTACDDECIICQELFSQHPDLKMLSCNHIFGKDCISQWLLSKSTCPLCRKKQIDPNKPSTSNILYRYQLC